MNNQLLSNYDLIECPVSDEDDYRIEVLISLRRLERLDKDEYSDDERQEAEEVSTIILQCAKLSLLDGNYSVNPATVNTLLRFIFATL